ncbi:hypothetical protein P7K49_016489, partial [Saguinus oedipus]
LAPASASLRDAGGSQGSRGLRAAWRCSRGDYSNRRGRRARLDCGLGLPQSGSLKGPLPLGLRLPLRAAQTLAKVGGAPRPAAGPTFVCWNL